MTAENLHAFQTIQTILRANGTPEEQIEAVLRAARNPARPKKMGTVKEVANLLQVHPRTVQRYARRGLLHPVRLTCRRIRYDLVEAECLAQEGGVVNHV